jgi:putative addiction module component (TIGR02574 family)
MPNDELSSSSHPPAVYEWVSASSLCPNFELSLSSMIDESLLAKVSSLSPADRLELIRMVWNTLSPDDLEMTDAEGVLLDSRLADMEAHPGDQSSWPVVKARLERLQRES